MKLKYKHGNLILGAVAIAAGGIILFLTKAQKLEFLKNEMPGPGMFPSLCALAVILCGVLLLAETFSKMLEAAREGKADSELEENILNFHELKNLLVLLILGGLILVLAERIGLLTCLGLSIVFYIKIQGKEPWRKAVWIGVAATVFLYVTFVWFLRVPVPKGPLGF
ncbi:MAG: tripartite tricarboxylate transporter TctB family protein [Lawsonibacter sp.]|nr:tripartite tricarboxylate transporter TctB family protein [Lawsonibacter sp.]